MRDSSELKTLSDETGAPVCDFLPFLASQAIRSLQRIEETV